MPNVSRKCFLSFIFSDVSKFDINEQFNKSVANDRVSGRLSIPIQKFLCKEKHE
jgi:hypothetical protein